MIENWSNERNAKKRRLLWNPNPYPVVVTDQGHALGGRTGAWVSVNDRTARRVLDTGLVIESEEWIILGIPRASTD